jgi:hypothetical protein
MARPVPDGWFTIPNIAGRHPAKEPPKDKLLIGRNYANRVEGSPERFTTEHLTWWSEADQNFVRIVPDMFRDTVWFFFHDWTELAP